MSKLSVTAFDLSNKIAGFLTSVKDQNTNIRMVLDPDDNEGQMVELHLTVDGGEYLITVLKK